MLKIEIEMIKSKHRIIGRIAAILLLPIFSNRIAEATTNLNESIRVIPNNATVYEPYNTTKYNNFTWPLVHKNTTSKDINLSYNVSRTVSTSISGAYFLLASCRSQRVKTDGNIVRYNNGFVSSKKYVSGNWSRWGYSDQVR